MLEVVLWKYMNKMYISTRGGVVFTKKSPGLCPYYEAYFDDREAPIAVASQQSGIVKTLANLVMACNEVKLDFSIKSVEHDCIGYIGSKLFFRGKLHELELQEVYRKLSDTLSERMFTH